MARHAANPAPDRQDGEGLSAADESNLLLDDVGVYVLTIAGMCGRGGFVHGAADVDLELLRTAVEARTRGLPRLRRRLVGTAGRHRLVDGPLHIEQHVRVVDAVDGAAGLQHLCARLTTTPLSHDRPLWELLIVPGAAPDGIGWVFRVHHALADGTEAARVMEALFDVDDGAHAPRPLHPPAARQTRSAGAAARRLVALVRPMRRTRLIGRSTPAHDVRTIRVGLASVADAVHALGATVNDGVLAAIGDGARAALRELGERTPPFLPVSVPVLLARAGGRANQVGAFVARVPLDETDVRERARHLAATTRIAAADARSRRLPWFTATRTGARVMRWYVARQRMVAVLSTNVRGPAQPRRLCGAPVEAVWAMPVIAGTVRLGVAAVSYAGTLSVTALWSRELGSAGERFADGIASGLHRLAEPRRPA